MSLKYRTSAGTSASNFTDLVVKVGDTLPIGTEVDYDGQTVPAGWQEVNPIQTFSYTLSNGAVVNFYKCGRVVQCELVGQQVAFTADADYTTTISNELAPYSDAFRNSFVLIELLPVTIGYMNIFYDAQTGVTNLRLRSKSTISGIYPRAEMSYLCR